MPELPKGSVDITGHQFGLLTAKRFIRRDGPGKELWEYKCSCGNTIELYKNRARSRSKLSCGCVQRPKLPRRGILLKDPVERKKMEPQRFEFRGGDANS